MHGNVWEWCLDWYGNYSGGMVTDPAGPASGSHRVLRGGGWNSIAARCRSAGRSRLEPCYRFDFAGFRLCLAPEARVEKTLAADGAKSSKQSQQAAPNPGLAAGPAAAPKIAAQLPSVTHTRSAAEMLPTQGAAPALSPSRSLTGRVTGEHGDAVYGDATRYNKNCYYGRVSKGAELQLLDQCVYKDEFGLDIIKVKVLKNEWQSEEGKVCWVGLVATSFAGGYNPATRMIETGIAGRGASATITALTFVIGMDATRISVVSNQGGTTLYTAALGWDSVVDATQSELGMKSKGATLRILENKFYDFSEIEARITKRFVSELASHLLNSVGKASFAIGQLDVSSADAQIQAELIEHIRKALRSCLKP
jgi:hypothetical protein